MNIEAWSAPLVSALNGLRVVLPEPPGRVSVVPLSETMVHKAPAADASSSWSAFISYADANGEISQRMISLRTITMQYDRPETINAFCHMRKAHRSFRVDRITEFACAETGELLDPTEYLLDLHRRGALRVDDKNLARLITILTFMGRCDGDFALSEQVAMQEAVERYQRYFGSTDDASIERALRESKRLAPSSGDLVRSIGGIIHGSEGPQLARFVWDSCVQIIDADGIQHEDELRWAIEVREALHIGGRG